MTRSRSAALLLIGASCLAAAGGCSGTSVPHLDPAAEQVLARYAPGVALGQSAGQAQSLPGYAFRPAPYVGLADTAYRGPNGTEAIYLRLDDYVDDGNPRVNPRAPVLEVQLQLRTPEAVAQVEAELTGRLGRPDVRCGHDDVANRQWRSVYWAGRTASVQLLAPRGSWLRTDRDALGVRTVRDVGLLTFGRLPADSMQGQRCS